MAKFLRPHPIKVGLELIYIYIYLSLSLKLRKVPTLTLTHPFIISAIAPQLQTNVLNCSSHHTPNRSHPTAFTSFAGSHVRKTASISIQIPSSCCLQTYTYIRHDPNPHRCACLDSRVSIWVKLMQDLAHPLNTPPRTPLTDSCNNNNNIMP